MNNYRNDKSVDPDDYGPLLDAVKREIIGSRVRAVLATDAGPVRQYWRIGRHILNHQPDEGLVRAVVPRLSVDLRMAFPEARVYSRTNLLYMGTFAAAWPECVPQTGRPIPWGHHIVLLDMLDCRATREFYARKTAEEGWARGVLITMIKGRLHLRIRHSPHSFTRTAPYADRRSVHRMIRDPHSLLDLPDEIARQEWNTGAPR